MGWHGTTVTPRGGSTRPRMVESRQGRQSDTHKGGLDEHGRWFGCRLAGTCRDASCMQACRRAVKGKKWLAALGMCVLEVRTVVGACWFRGQLAPWAAGTMTAAAGPAVHVGVVYRGVDRCSARRRRCGGRGAAPEGRLLSSEAFKLGGGVLKVNLPGMGGRQHRGLTWQRGQGKTSSPPCVPTKHVLPVPTACPRWRAEVPAALVRPAASATSLQACTTPHLEAGQRLAEGHEGGHRGRAPLQAGKPAGRCALARRLLAQQEQREAGHAGQGALHFAQRQLQAGQARQVEHFEPAGGTQHRGHLRVAKGRRAEVGTAGHCGESCASQQAPNWRQHTGCPETRRALGQA